MDSLSSCLSVLFFSLSYFLVISFISDFSLAANSSGVSSLVSSLICSSNVDNKSSLSVIFSASMSASLKYVWAITFDVLDIASPIINWLR